MSLRQKYRKILSEIIPAGAVGVSLLLGSASPSPASRDPVGSQPAASDPFRVSERLAAIRDAVSDVEGAVAKPGESEQQLAWGNWWRNGGWRNWRNGWHNGGWHNW